MAVFFDHRVQSPQGLQITEIVWHKTYSVLAVAGFNQSTGGVVSVFQEEGKVASANSVQRKTKTATTLSWHPTKKVLAVGWQTGEITIRNEQDDELYDAPRLHKSEITVMHWTSNGSHLLTGDSNGLLLMWKADGRGRLQQNPTMQHTVSEQPTYVVITPPPAVDPAHLTDMNMMGSLEALTSQFLFDTPPPSTARTPFIDCCNSSTLASLLRSGQIFVVFGGSDLLSLARAAVSGDENALDMFAWQKGRSNPKFSAAAMGQQEAVTFFIGGDKGGVYFLNDSFKVSNQFIADGPVKKLLYYDDKNVLVTIATTMMLSLHNISSDGTAVESLRVKINGKSNTSDIIWAGKGLLATCTSEKYIRMWDLDKDENYVLNLQSNGYSDPTEIITCIAYSPAKGVLAGGTGNGKVVQWKYAPHLVYSSGKKREEPEDAWMLQTPSVVSGTITDLVFGSSKSLLGCNTIENAYILNEQLPAAHCCQGNQILSIKDQRPTHIRVPIQGFSANMAAVQTGTMQLSIDIFSLNSHYELKTDILVKGVYTTKDALAIMDGERVVVYEIAGPSTFRPVGSFESRFLHMCMHEQNIYTLEPGKIQVRNFQGTVKQFLNLPDHDDEVLSMDVCSEYLVISTAAGAVQVFDLSRREAKNHTAPKYLHGAIADLNRIVSAKCNANGTKVSITATKYDGAVDSKIYIWDIEIDTVQFFDFSSGQDESDAYFRNSGDGDAGSTMAEKGKRESARDIAGRHPVSHCWDWEEPKLLVCEAKFSPPKETEKSSKDARKPATLARTSMDEIADVMVVSLFCTTDNGILIQDSFVTDSNCSRLLNLEIPYYHFIKKIDHVTSSSPTPTNRPAGSTLCLPGPSPDSMIVRRIHRDFVGLEMAEKTAREAMMNFSFYLTLGDLDEAFKAIKLIKSDSVWENMAKMCVKTRRLDVARVCLGNMGNARGAKLLREAMKEPELDAQIACLAIQLGLYDDAERCLKNCKRYDLLNTFYQNSGEWEKAIGISEMYDRIHFRSTSYNYAKFLESQEDYVNAIKYFEKSGTHCFEVPRMMFEDVIALENYIVKSNDKALCKWWAQYKESNGEMDVAIKFYEAAQDFLSLVRIFCFMNNIPKAADVCNASKDKAACYHLARQYENNGQLQEAIHFFTRAQAYGNAIRLCRDNGFDDKLINMALLGKPDDMVDAARYYEFKPGHQDKAVMLYHKAGYFSKALELAFSSKQYSALQMVSESLDESTDPQLLQRCADFFVDNSQFDRAVDLLAAAKRYWDALKICMEQHVPMTEELVEKLSPKEAEESDATERNKILEGVGDVCMAQRQYHLATKKFTQAGNRLKAMKALLKSGDTEKVIFFANVSRQKEIYVMAGHYLQSLDWQKDPEIMKNIITFYTKGRAPEPLAGFYDACAQLEIDEFQNYEKALGAMNEAYKCLSKTKAGDDSTLDMKMSDLKNRMTLIDKFVKAKSLLNQSNDEGLKLCQSLLSEPNCDKAVRLGDIYGFMAEYFARGAKWKQAYSCIEEIRANIPRANLAQYISTQTLEAIHRALNIQYKDNKHNGYQGHKSNDNDNDEDEGEILDEDVAADD